MAPRRLGRLRRTQALRDLVSQTEVSCGDLIAPYFVIEGRKRREPTSAMSGVDRLSADTLVEEVRQARDLGVEAVLLFGSCAHRDNRGSQAYREDGPVQRAAEAIKKRLGDVIVITDVCLCAYTPHGHCGIVKNQNPKIKKQNRIIDNEATVKTLARIAVSHARAGADFVAPSAMAEGQVARIREALDRSGFGYVGILAYSAKYASNFYGPFREALDSYPRYGDRRGYQMDYRNSDEALEEIAQDIDEGADIVMVKPALAYLDIIARAKELFGIPLAAYNVSGEYAMVKTYCEKLDEGSRARDEMGLVTEILTSIKRAGADLIITYHAKEAAKWLARR